MTSSDELHVVFGTAALGQALMRELVKRGRRVRMVSRGGKIGAPVEPIPSSVECVRGDASDVSSIRTVCEGATTVYNCAAPPYTDWARLYPPMQHALIEGVGATGAKLVSAESVYMYGPVDVPMTEDLPYAAQTHKGQIRSQMATELMQAHKEGRVKAAIGRAPDFYGPGAAVTTIYGERVFEPALQGKKVSVMGKLDNPHTFIYIDDFGRGLATVGEREEAMGEVWHLSCAPTPTQRELLTLIFEAAGHPPKLGETPSLEFKLLSPVVPIMRELSELLYQWEKPYEFNHDKFDRAFGAGFTPHPEAVAKTVEWFRAQVDKPLA